MFAAVLISAVSAYSACTDNYKACRCRQWNGSNASSLGATLDECCSLKQNGCDVGTNFSGTGTTAVQGSGSAVTCSTNIPCPANPSCGGQYKIADTDAYYDGSNIYACCRPKMCQEYLTTGAAACPGGADYWSFYGPGRLIGSYDKSNGNFTSYGVYAICCDMSSLTQTQGLYYKPNMGAATTSCPDSYMTLVYDSSNTAIGFYCKCSDANYRVTQTKSYGLKCCQSTQGPGSGTYPWTGNSITCQGVNGGAPLYLQT